MFAEVLCAMLLSFNSFFFLCESIPRVDDGLDMKEYTIDRLTLRVENNIADVNGMM